MVINELKENKQKKKNNKIKPLNAIGQAKCNEHTQCFGSARVRRLI